MLGSSGAQEPLLMGHTQQKLMQRQGALVLLIEVEGQESALTDSGTRGSGFQGSLRT